MDNEAYDDGFTDGMMACIQNLVFLTGDIQLGARLIQESGLPEGELRASQQASDFEAESMEEVLSIAFPKQD